ncbi:MAG: DegT/DnrJ/EryC1/StrS family aminotransferase [Oscillospiraceae bacterium]|nr:DegT/DnrJ/EryC1/StrS family aminotransferase [Oscillospiraceae bacterium]
MIRSGGPGVYAFGDEERAQVNEVLESGYLSRYGSEDDSRFKHKVVTLEREFAKFVGVKHVVATSGGTMSIMCALASLGIGAGDEVIVPGYTFIASISSIIMVNAIPVLAEIDDSLTIDPKKIEQCITQRTRCIMPVHMLGNPSDMDRIMAIAKKYGLYVLEDCCQSIGGTYKGKETGSIGAIGAYSLNVHKTISCGDGGMVATDDDELYERAFGFHDQGHKPNRMGLEIGNRNIIGMNMRMNELSGAVALAQLRKLPTILHKLRESKKQLKDMLVGLPHFQFRRINDVDGECATMLTMIFETKDLAEKFGGAIGAKPLFASGWHNYSNMEQVLSKRTAMRAGCPYNCDKYPFGVSYGKGMLPQTDDILERSINVSVGVVDAGIGASYGINLNSSPEEIANVGENMRRILLSL